MTKHLPDSARLIWVPTFVAAAAHSNNVAAGKALDVDGSTVGRQIEDFEVWLHRVLVWPHDPFTLTECGEAFVSKATRILELITEGDLNPALSRTRVLPDATVTVDGVPLSTPATKEIGRLMVGARAPLLPPPPENKAKISAVHIVIKKRDQ